MFCKFRRLDLLRTGQFSDCELHVSFVDRCQRQCRRHFRCHQQMLGSASLEFQRLIDNASFQHQKRIIQVNDASPDAYETLLLYIYTYEISSGQTIDLYPELSYLAEKYQMPDVMDCYIGQLLEQDLPIEAVLRILQLASDHNSKPDIKQLVEKQVLPVASQVICDDSFLELSLQQLKALMTILKQHGSMSEEQLLAALKKYQQHNEMNYTKMKCFQEFVEVANLFEGILYDAEGNMVVKAQKSNGQMEDQSERQPEDEPKDKPEAEA